MSPEAAGLLPHFSPTYRQFLCSPGYPG